MNINVWAWFLSTKNQLVNQEEPSSQKPEPSASDELSQAKSDAESLLRNRKAKWALTQYYSGLGRTPFSWLNNKTTWCGKSHNMPVPRNFLPSEWETLRGNSLPCQWTTACWIQEVYQRMTDRNRGRTTTNFAMNKSLERSYHVVVNPVWTEIPRRAHK